MQLYNIVFTTPQTSLEKHTLAVVEVQQLPELENTGKHF